MQAVFFSGSNAVSSAAAIAGHLWVQSSPVRVFHGTAIEAACMR
jgi:hypothetical protein